MKHIAEPEWIGRKDAEHGEWSVEDCEPRRGIPATSITERKMLAPAHDTEQARVIRAHEMMHAKVSPAGEWDAWQRRKIASVEAMVVCEELRVNFLCQQAGFDVKSHLTDGGEVADGERVAATRDWKAAVHMAIATAGTASNKAFLNGVRRHNREWGSVLADISKRAVKEMQKAHRTGMLASTSVHERAGLAPYGFTFTEKIAEWVDRLAGTTPPDEKEEVEGESESDENTPDDEGKREGEHSNKGVRPATNAEFRERLKKITPDRMDGRVPYWGELIIEKLPLSVMSKGNLGKKKSASNVGRSPRRLHRYMSDPQRRIFDNKRRGMGGVVCVDASGSMGLTHDHVRMILEASPGATVIAYSDKDNGGGAPNAWILADRGRMVSEDNFPEMNAGNGVDFPALEWAVKHRQHSSAPVIWVTDGGVCGPSQGFSEILANQCTTLCLEKKVYAVETPDDAVKLLTGLSNGVKPHKRSWPYMLEAAWRNRNGVSIPV